MKIFAVAVGKKIRKEDFLKVLSGRNESLFMVDDINNLSSFLPDVMRECCEGVEGNMSPQFYWLVSNPDRTLISGSDYWGVTVPVIWYQMSKLTKTNSERKLVYKNMFCLLYKAVLLSTSSRTTA